MICTIITASVLTLLPMAKPVYHSVDFFDSRSRVTERVLDRTICPDIERTQAPDSVLLELAKTDAQKEAIRKKAAVNARRNVIAVSNHCKNSPRVGADNVRECDLN